MRRTRVLWEVYVTRFDEALDRYKQHRLSAEEAGELPCLSGRHFRSGQQSARVRVPRLREQPVTRRSGGQWSG
jgi:hypothetical protein